MNLLKASLDLFEDKPKACYLLFDIPTFRTRFQNHDGDNIDHLISLFVN